MPAMHRKRLAHTRARPKINGGALLIARLPTAAPERKGIPIFTGLLDYFPDALAEVAKVSRVGNDQHNPGQMTHWARGKSADHADTIGRHLMDRGLADIDGQLHTAKAAWRVLALLQEELETTRGLPPSRGSRVSLKVTR